MASILIAEDDPLIGSLLEKGLGDNGYSTRLVDDGEQARYLSLMEDFDLLILDMGLPKLDGLQVIQALRSHGSGVPVLVVTGRREVDAAACLDAGADDYMRKPFHFADLLIHVRTLLGEEEKQTETP